MRSIYVPGDATCFCLFEGGSEEAVREANALAGTAFEPVSEALLIEVGDIGSTPDRHGIRSWALWPHVAIDSPRSASDRDPVPGSVPASVLPLMWRSVHRPILSPSSSGGGRRERGARDGHAQDARRR